MLKKILYLILVVTLLTVMGCSQKVINTCPPFVSPNKVVVEKLRSLKSKEVDDWIIRLFKLKKQLKACSED